MNSSGIVVDDEGHMIKQALVWDNAQIRALSESSHSIHRHYEIIQSEQRECPRLPLLSGCTFWHIPICMMYFIFIQIHISTSIYDDDEHEYTPSSIQCTTDAVAAAAAMASVHKYTLVVVFFISSSYFMNLPRKILECSKLPCWHIAYSHYVLDETSNGKLPRKTWKLC